ncbi:MAG: Eco57I restriction-modification methylase domain-containing protein [Sphingomonadales bacterium]|nr:Eco57I restriction-modification methylase domain-containing protein [Sphingomonadales bacterium]MDE2171364.1 Eco57I restriction-modification methylase domain-containing protein [Sphingomonadales bacterium]
MPRGEISSGRSEKRHPLDWYVEQGWEWLQIIAAIGWREKDDDVTIWDPACGYGHCGSWLQNAGFTGPLLLSDLVTNIAWADFVQPELARFVSMDFLETARPAGTLTYLDGLDRLHHLPSAPERVSIWSNPPYSYKKVWYDGRKVSISEAFVRHALKLATDRVVMILPHKWLAMGKRRSRLVRIDHPPAFVLHFCERPSMPPGDMISAMGVRAYRGGMIDYCAVVWDVRAPTAPGETRTIWLPPLAGDN